MGPDILVPLAGMAMTAGIVWITHWKRKNETDQRAAVIRHLIDKFSTGEDFTAALRGPEGRQLFEALAPRRRQPKTEPVGIFVFGAVSTSLGLGFLWLAAAVNQGMVYPGVILASIGAGLLLSAWVARRSAARDRERQPSDSAEPEDDSAERP